MHVGKWFTMTASKRYATDYTGTVVSADIGPDEALYILSGITFMVSSIRIAEWMCRNRKRV